MTEGYAQKRVMVMGGAGYIGSVLTQQLLERGYQVDVFDSFRFGDQSLDRLREFPQLRLIDGDVRDIPAVTEHVRDAYGVVMLASLVGEPACDRDQKETVDINYVATKAVAEACRYYETPRFIFASTDSAYGIQVGVMVEDSPLNPVSLYGRLKQQSEQEILGLADASFRPTILRMATIYGLSPRMRFDLVVNALSLNAHVKGKIVIHGGAQWRPLVHVADAAKAYVMSLEAPIEDVGGQAFNVGSNEQNYQIGQLGALVQEVFPDVEIETIAQSPDLRDYYVSFDKITDTLDYHVDFSIVDGVRQIRDALADGTIADHTDPRHYNVPQAS